MEGWKDAGKGRHLLSDLAGLQAPSSILTSFLGLRAESVMLPVSLVMKVGSGVSGLGRAMAWMVCSDSSFSLWSNSFTTWGRNRIRACGQEQENKD